MVNSFIDSPSAYTLDVGLSYENTLDLVEVNDAWATGRYSWGISSDDYIKWLYTRWKEIVKHSNPKHNRLTIDQLTYNV